MRIQDLEYTFSKYIEHTNKYLSLITFFIIYSLCKPLEIIITIFDNKKDKAWKNKKKRCAIVFSQNQLNIANKLVKKGLELEIYYLSNKELLYHYKFDMLYSIIKNNHILKHVLFNEVLEVIKINKARVLKLVLLEILLKNIIEQYQEIINFNDHSPANVLLFKISNQLGLKTIYVQHATVSDKFPELYHDVNILFSKDSYEKYENRYDKVWHVAYDLRLPPKGGFKTNYSKNVLICTSLLDDYKSIIKLYDYLKRLKIFEVVIRPHPRDTRFNYKSMNVSSNKNLYDDLNRSKYVIGNETNALLEAMYLKKYVYKFLFSDSIDCYGFLKKGLILNEYNKIPDLVESIKSDTLDYDISKITQFIGNVDMSDKELINLFNES